MFQDSESLDSLDCPFNMYPESGNVLCFSLVFSLLPTPEYVFRVNGGAISFAPFVNKMSSMWRPLSTMTASPYSSLSRSPQCSVMCLSDAFLPHRELKKTESTIGVYANKTFVCIVTFVLRKCFILFIVIGRAINKKFGTIYYNTN